MKKLGETALAIEGKEFGEEKREGQKNEKRGEFTRAEPFFKKKKQERKKDYTGDEKKRKVSYERTSYSVYKAIQRGRKEKEDEAANV